MKRKGNFFGSFCFAASLCLLVPFAYAILSRQFMCAAEIAACVLFFMYVSYVKAKYSPQGQEGEEKEGKKIVLEDEGCDTKSVEEDVDLDKDEKNDEADKRIKVLEDEVSELKKGIERIDAAISKREPYMNERDRTKTLQETCKKSSIYAGGSNAALPDKSQHISNKPAETKAEKVQKAQKFLVNVDCSSLRDEISTGDRIKVYRTGTGSCQLSNYEELIPKNFELNQKFTNNMYNMLKSYNLLKLFELNSSKVIDHKIVKLEAAKICVSEEIDAHTEQFEITLKKKGRIEVDNPIINDGIF